MIRKTLGILFCVGSLLAAAQVEEDDSASVASSEKETSSEEREEAIRRGEYLVHHVAMCVQCHSPRDAEGTLDKQRLLSGAPMPVETPFEEQEWAFRAPSLRGLPGGWSEQDLVKFLQTGTPPTAHSILPPMPPFRLNQRDATSVAAYLQSLGG